jgi:DNA-binding phage protein
MKILYELIAEMKKYGIRKIAKDTGISENTLYNWSSGKSIPTIINAQRVASAIGMELLLFEKLDD